MESIPWQIEAIYNSISGTLRCQKCDGYITAGGEGRTNSNFYEYQIAKHKCVVVPGDYDFSTGFVFDFESELSLKDQYQLFQRWVPQQPLVRLKTVDDCPAFKINSWVINTQTGKIYEITTATVRDTVIASWKETRQPQPYG